MRRMVKTFVLLLAVAVLLSQAFGCEVKKTIQAEGGRIRYVEGRDIGDRVAIKLLKDSLTGDCYLVVTNWGGGVEVVKLGSR